MTGKPAVSFDDNYLAYWKKRVAQATDGSRVADENVFDGYLGLLNLTPEHRVLDLGCGYGRLYPAIARYTTRIIGIDISSAMLAEAARYPYQCLFEAQAEQTRLPGCFLDRIVTWGTFDVTEQGNALKEANRILKPGGLLLVTGKNLAYHANDDNALVAERNAKLKGFPNHFTDLSLLFDRVNPFGLSLERAFAFERRGDLGENRAFVITAKTDRPFYEYLAILKKTAEAVSEPPPIAHEFSTTARHLAAEHGFSANVRGYFSWHKTAYGE